MKIYARLWLFAALLSLATSGRCLTIVPTFDATITNSPTAAAQITAIKAAIQVFQSKIADNNTVKVTFVTDETIGLGQSTTFGGNFSYTNYLVALRNRITSRDDTNALSQLPNSATDPVFAGTKIHLTTALARTVGLTSYTNIDSTIAFKMSLMNLTRPPTDSHKYDLQQVAEHELDEVLGTSSGLGRATNVYPADLFRYTTNLVRTYTTNGDDAYFSIDGTNLLARYNMDPGGDFGDWWSFYTPSNWSPTLGVTRNNPQVQDAFTGPNKALDLSSTELTALDVLGWTMTTNIPSLKLVRSSTNQLTLSWPTNFVGYVLQERTSLLTGSWANSASGATNPVVITFGGVNKFYRLTKPAGRPALTAPLPVLEDVPLYPTTHVYRPGHL